MGQDQVISSEAPRRQRPRFLGQYIIKSRFQFKFAIIIFTFLAVAALTIWLEGNYVIKSLIDRGVVTDDMAVNQLNILNKMIFYTSVLALAVTFGLSLFFSHFVAGPIYRFESIFKQMKTGDMTAVVHLRKHDELKDTAELFNHALVSLRQMIRKERAGLGVALTSIRKVVEELKAAGKEDQASKLEEILFELHNNPPEIKI